MRRSTIHNGVINGHKKRELLKFIYYMVVCLLLRNAQKLVPTEYIRSALLGQSFGVHFSKVNKLPYDIYRLQPWQTLQIHFTFKVGLFQMFQNFGLFSSSAYFRVRLIFETLRYDCAKILLGFQILDGLGNHDTHSFADDEVSFDSIGESYESFVRKRELGKYQSQSKVI